VRFSIVAGFRQIPDEWLRRIELFLLGETRDLLEQGVLALLEKPSARRHAERTQETIDLLARFYEMEAQGLRRACRDLGIVARFVPQRERDRLFLIAREARKRREVSCDARSS
jgi:hypothetical protein